LVPALLALASPLTARADFVLSIESSADVNHLAVGQAVAFDVRLAGIDPADANTFLNYLAATTQYDSTLLSVTAAVTPGAIAADPLNFLGTPLSGGADGLYDGVFLNSPTPISDSGTFYSFTVTTLRAGTGTLSFSAAAATLLSDPDQNNQFTPTLTSLDITVEGPTVATPAPPALALALSGLGAAAATSAGRRLGRRLGRALHTPRA
jgi:hypothetical protein